MLTNLDVARSEEDLEGKYGFLVVEVGGRKGKSARSKAEAEVIHCSLLSPLTRHES